MAFDPFSSFEELCYQMYGRVRASSMRSYSSIRNATVSSREVLEVIVMTDTPQEEYDFQEEVS